LFAAIVIEETWGYATSKGGKKYLMRDSSLGYDLLLSRAN